MARYARLSPKKTHFLLPNQDEKWEQKVALLAVPSRALGFIFRTYIIYSNHLILGNISKIDYI
jgi:hypothetical protein